jgi:integrase
MIEMKAKDYLAASKKDGDETIPEEMSVLTESQLSQFIITAMESPNFALFEVASITGMREGELLGLMKKDVEFGSDYAIIKVRRQVRRTPQIGMMFSPVKTKAGLRAIRVGENTSRILKEQFARTEVMKSTIGSRWQEYGLVFPSTVGTPLEISNLRREFNRVLKEAGVPKIRFHDLRHTAASIMLSHKIPVVIVSKILGHSKPSVTMDIYYHFMPSSNEEAVKLMDDLTPIAVEISSCAVLDEEPNDKVE